MLTLRQRIFLIVSIIVAFILVSVLFIIYGKKNPQDQEETNTSSEQETVPEAVQKARSILVSKEGIREQGAEANQIPSKPDPTLYARQLSRLFVERFGTYSNQNNNAHLADTSELGTLSMSAWLQTQMLEQSVEYKGVTTRVISTSVREESDLRFLIGIEAQQEWSSESSDGSAGIQTELKQRKGRVEIVKVGEEWKVNGFWWED
ncbi:MAG: hypothetical protein HYY51_04865 [Candidatus Magasanikbacteria bacterium]|nr:hypothetical protein [Candidatus Magasanikbacteria bacterium]